MREIGCCLLGVLIPLWEYAEVPEWEDHLNKLTNMFQAWNFIFERARPFCFYKGHFHWKILKSMANF